MASSTTVVADCGCLCWITPQMQKAVDRLVKEHSREEVYLTCVHHAPPIPDVDGDIFGVTEEGEHELSKSEYDAILRMNGGTP